MGCCQSEPPKIDQEISSQIYAISILRPHNNSGVSGIIKFIQDGQIVKIQAKVKGLSKGKHGFHIHEYGNLTHGCTSAGAHFNPQLKNHGGPGDPETKRHVGDLGNIETKGSEQESVYYLEDIIIKLEGIQSIIGRSVVVHADEDDLGRGNFEDSLKTGHAGDRLACGEIGISGKFDL